MKVMLINNDGAGFAELVEVASGTTVKQLFESRIGEGREANYLIRVNRLPTTAETVLHEGDRISITPKKIEGAEFVDATVLPRQLMSIWDSLQMTMLTVRSWFKG